MHSTGTPNIAQHRSAKHHTAQLGRVCHSTVQHCTIPHSTAAKQSAAQQHSSTEHSTAQQQGFRLHPLPRPAVPLYLHRNPIFPVDFSLNIEKVFTESSLGAFLKDSHDLRTRVSVTVQMYMG